MVDVLVTHAGDRLVTPNGDLLVADDTPDEGGGNPTANLPLTDVVGHVNDKKAAQLEAWATENNVPGKGLELELAFWIGEGYTSIPFGDERIVAMEALAEQSFPQLTLGDIEDAFWTNAS